MLRAWCNRLVDMLVSPPQPFSKPRRTKHVQLYFATTSTQLPDEPGLFSRLRSIEGQLKEGCVLGLINMGIPAFQADDMCSIWLREAKDEAKKEGTESLPRNYGDHLLRQEATDPKIQASLVKLRKEGVTDDDIRNWWNRPDLERRLLLKIDENTRMVIVIDQCDKMGITKENKDEVLDKAEAHVRKYCPFWGDPEGSKRVFGDDRPLPVELRDRINLWRDRKSLDPSFQKEMDNSTTFNALVRKEITRRNL